MNGIFNPVAPGNAEVIQTHHREKLTERFFRSEQNEAGNSRPKRVFTHLDTVERLKKLGVAPAEFLRIRVNAGADTTILSNGVAVQVIKRRIGNDGFIIRMHSPLLIEHLKIIVGTLLIRRTDPTESTFWQPYFLEENWLISCLCLRNENADNCFTFNGFDETLRTDHSVKTGSTLFGNITLNFIGIVDTYDAVLSIPGLLAFMDAQQEKASGKPRLVGISTYRLHERCADFTCGFCFNAGVFIKLIQLVEEFGTPHQITPSSSTAISSLASSDSVSIPSNARGRTQMKWLNLIPQPAPS